MLEESQKFQQAKRTLTLQQQLRPLFYPVELNLESDTTPFDHQAAKIEVPSGFLIDPMLAKGSIAIERAHYEAALAAAQTKFPRTPQTDADHGWLTPVKAFSDALAIGSLVKQGVVDQEFVNHVLAVDLTNPLSLLPTARCKLLRVLPENAAGDWQEVFKASPSASNDPAAQELLKKLTDPSRNAQFHQTRAARFLDAFLIPPNHRQRPLPASSEREPAYWSRNQKSTTSKRTPSLTQLLNRFSVPLLPTIQFG